MCFFFPFFCLPVFRYFFFPFLYHLLILPVLCTLHVSTVLLSKFVGIKHESGYFIYQWYSDCVLWRSVVAREIVWDSKHIILIIKLINIILTFVILFCIFSIFLHNLREVCLNYKSPIIFAFINSLRCFIQNISLHFKIFYFIF